MLLPAITFTAQRQICADAIVSVANPISPPSPFFLLGIFHLQKQGDSVLIFILGLLSINLAHSVWRSLWSETHVGTGYCTSFYFPPVGKSKCRVFSSDVIKTGAFCYCLFTGAVSIGSDWDDLFKHGGLGLITWL